MGGQYGVKETSEAAAALFKIGVEIKKLLKNGAQIQDAFELAKLMTQEGPLKAAVDAGLQDINKAKAELAEVDLEDGLELFALVSPAVKEFLKA